FEIADGGTLFLDEIGDMNREAQARLLRVLENRTFYSVGGVQQKKVDVRIVAATNKDLYAQVEQGLFRKDLYYRINIIRLKMPPLRERKEDVPLLTDYFLESFARLHNEGKKQLSREVMDIFLAHRWPGNIRELKNLIERLVVFSGKSEIIEKHLIPEEIAHAALPVGSAKGLVKGTDLRETMKSLERDIIRDVLLQSGWNKALAYNTLGVSRATLDNKIAEYALKPNV
ncbi:MAG: sigma-54-dependent Fis family transcriptional regulator, partial [Planctomycetes bacterium]|nr:sigma-54-dependent Fis family transcriptional regulator [Planctomycetota bacterium]